MKMEKKIFNLCLVATVVAILAVLGFYVRVGATADAVVVLKTSGMTCRSCADRITKTLQSQRGVTATEIDLDGGWVIAGYDSKQVAPEKIAQKVTGSGFGSSIQVVLTPEQFRQTVGHVVGDKGTKSSCCGAKGCCAK